MPLTPPPTETSLGRKVVVILEDPPAAPTGIPTLTEINAAFFAQYHMYTPFNVMPDQNTGQGPRKLGARVQPTKKGLVTYPAVDVQYSYLPQQVGTPGAAGNELYELLEEDVIRTAVVFNGLDGDLDAIPANAVGDVYLIDPGVKRKGETGEGEFDEFSTTQTCVIAGGEPIAKDRVFAA